MGAQVGRDGTGFTIWSTAQTLTLCLFEGEREIERLAMAPDGQGLFSLFVPGLGPGAHYGLRADGPYDPAAALWFDPDKLLLDPYATAIDRPFAYDPALAARRGEGGDTAPLMPRAVVEASSPPLTPPPPAFAPGELIYELSVRAFTMRHPDVPAHQRGTIAALAHPAVIDHLRALHVSAVELMPINAWIDERHLPPLGLRNGWGYNPVGYFALDPRLAPGGMAELRRTVAALHDAGIAVLLDMVYNHDGESDVLGPTLSLRGLDARGYFRHDDQWRLINDAGTGNCIDCNAPVARCLILDSLRHFAGCGIDGFRFDLAPALGRLRDGFDPQAPLLREMLADPLLADRILIAEPWDIGPGGYQLGRFDPRFLEWNDRYRDDMRRFWRGDPHMLGAFATRLAGSSDIFAHHGATATRSVNFLAAHDGFTLADMTAYAQRHNHANGEDNRDGHGENFSWNNGVEGASVDPAIVAARRRDVKALLSTLFLSRGTIMLTAGDEFGRSQQGNNNAYAQDNEMTWLDWEGRDREIEAHAMALATLRADIPALHGTGWLAGEDVAWLRPDGAMMAPVDWEMAEGSVLTLYHREEGVALCFNRGVNDVTCETPIGPVVVAARSVAIRRKS
ncbi:glycogen debranching protein GlgX [Sphingobium aquiterrae]|uniref:glycogen debranching protein GlgX n=1 Tax=Sphingobium aquiterrae TaxID=2038656 RepID=UPI003AFA9DD0